MLTTPLSTLKLHLKNALVVQVVLTDEVAARYIVGRAAEKRARYAVTVKREDGESAALSLNQKQLRGLGLLDEDGNVQHEPVAVTVTVEIETM